MKRIGRWFMDLRIASKIMTCYFVMLFLFLAAGASAYRQLSDLTAGKVRQMSNETTISIGNNLDFLMDTLNNQTMILLSNQTVQNALDPANRENSLLLQTRVCTYLADFMNFNDMISSIYLFDRDGAEYYVDSAPPKPLSLGAVRKAGWYPELVKLSGGYLLKLNGGGTFPGGEETYVSLVRIINHINTQKPIGLMVVNVSADYIQKSVMKGSGAYSMRLILRDESGRRIVDTARDRGADGADVTGENGSVIRKVGGETCIISTLTNRFGWKITSVTPFSELTKQVVTTNIALIVLFLLIGVIFCAVFVLISLLITKPVHRLAVSMKEAENGTFREIDIRTGNDEIGRLKDVYNMMVRRTVALFDDIVREQAMKRKKELEVLQMQIKPHFLYNSFDAIGSLALSGENKEVYRLVQALGKYYRGFLNNCDEELPIRHELEIIDNYLTIQEIRFPGRFTVRREIDERVLDCKMPGLILQPLVENAVNHGIRGKPGHGTLTIRAFPDGGRIRLSVEDDGVGMDPETVRAILGGRSGGVGLKTTMERLRLFYSADGLLRIESEKGVGTRVLLTLPGGREAFP